MARVDEPASSFQESSELILSLSLVGEQSSKLTGEEAMNNKKSSMYNISNEAMKLIPGRESFFACYGHRNLNDL
jgi:hypothetical protein